MKLNEMKLKIKLKKVLIQTCPISFPGLHMRKRLHKLELLQLQPGSMTCN